MCLNFFFFRKVKKQIFNYLPMTFNFTGGGGFFLPKFDLLIFNRSNFGRPPPPPHTHTHSEIKRHWGYSKRYRKLSPPKDSHFFCSKNINWGSHIVKIPIGKSFRSSSQRTDKILIQCTECIFFLLHEFKISYFTFDYFISV